MKARPLKTRLREDDVIFDGDTFTYKANAGIMGVHTINGWQGTKIKDFLAQNVSIDKVNRVSPSRKIRETPLQYTASHIGELRRLGRIRTDRRIVEMVRQISEENLNRIRESVLDQLDEIQRTRGVED